MPKAPLTRRKRPGRPLTESKKLTRSANVRLNDEDAIAFNAAAEAMSKRLHTPITLSAWLRLAGREKIANEKLGLKTAFENTIRDLEGTKP